MTKYEGQRLIRIHDLETILCHRKSWIYKHISLGNIPKPTKISSKDAFWDEADILAVKDRLLSGTFGQPAA